MEKLSSERALPESKTALVASEILIEGSQKAVMFDTGLDLFNIKDYVAKHTSVFSPRRA